MSKIRKVHISYLNGTVKSARYGAWTFPTQWNAAARKSATASGFIIGVLAFMLTAGLSIAVILGFFLWFTSQLR